MAAGVPDDTRGGGQWRRFWFDEGRYADEETPVGNYVDEVLPEGRPVETVDTGGLT